MFCLYCLPLVLSCSNLKLHQTIEVKNIFKQEKIRIQLTFNPGLTLTSFRTTRPGSSRYAPQGTGSHGFPRLISPQAAQTLFVIYLRDSIALRFEPFKRMYENRSKIAQNSTCSKGLKKRSLP